MRRSLGQFLQCCKTLSCLIASNCLPYRTATLVGLVLGLQTTAMSSPHDLPQTECFSSFDSLFLPERFGHFPEVSENAMLVEHPSGFGMQEFPNLDLLDLSGLPSSAVEHLTCELPKMLSSDQSNYLATREKLDDDCDAIQSIARSAVDHVKQTYRGLYSRDYLVLTEQLSKNFEQIAESVPLKSTSATKIQDSETPDPSESLDSDRFTATNNALGPEFFQPLFVIYRLDGKEFLVPSGHARHWNYVPHFDPEAISHDNHEESEDLKIPISQLRLALADGLEQAAKGLFDLASRLRADAPANKSISHTATSEQAGLK